MFSPLIIAYPCLFLLGYLPYFDVCVCLLLTLIGIDVMRIVFTCLSHHMWQVTNKRLNLGCNLLMHLSYLLLHKILKIKGNQIYDSFWLHFTFQILFKK